MISVFLDLFILCMIVVLIMSNNSNNPIIISSILRAVQGLYAPESAQWSTFPEDFSSDNQELVLSWAMRCCS